MRIGHASLRALTLVPFIFLSIVLYPLGHAIFLDTTTEIAANSTLCLSEHIGNNTYTHITVSGYGVPPEEGIKIVIKEEGADKPIYEELNVKSTVSVSFTTIHGTGVVCCVSTPNTPVHVSFSIKSGADARDYSIIAKTSHMDPIDAHIQKALDEFVAFHKAQVAGSRSIDKTSAEAARTYALLKRFAIANSVFMVIVTAAYIFYFRNFFMLKKVI